MTSRNQALLAGLDPARQTGAEVGPLDRPIVTRDMTGDGGRVFYVDHLDTEALRRKYVDDRSVDGARLAEIDFVWKPDGLDGLVGQHGKLDYIVASHVVEHVPDLIGWLEALRRALHPGGEIRLVVPDKRFCFDHHRATSTLADLLAARAASAQAPSLRQIADYFLHVVEADTAQIWAGNPPPPPVVDAGRYAWAEGVCREVRESGRYQDVHCWVFTPGHFCRTLAELASFGAVGFECSLFRDTEPGGLEFLAGLRPCDEPLRAAASWRDAVARAAAKPPRRRWPPRIRFWESA